ncbi:FAD-dependent oxidoreductase [Aminiphilus circumscriptus]|uniref:FAD-dependent oxidoreductase n=1 Tax=Aminiphilus circumscriptus TaxID=290732 RepID=UPI000492B84B|nr:FAD-dependent oxidoreductase [Aminiphilus circumscriptus]
MSERTVKVILNGRDVYGKPGQRLLDLCAECGIEIPTLCYDPHLSLHGGCSICLVDIQGARALSRACATTITPNMVVRTDTDRVRKARKLGLELLFSDHVGDCRPPCALACPARGDVQAYVNLAAQGKYAESLEVLHRNVTLPASIGRVCPAPCQEKCRRNLVDEEPVSIREIKRFVADSCLAEGDLGGIPSIEENGRSVAVVGGGPAGLSAAYFLRLKGYAVTIFDKEPLLGGMMRYGIPDYRLPQDILQAEINWILAHGVEARTETALGKDITLEQLRDEHDAVVLAMGCWRSSPLRCPGEKLPGVLGGIDFLYSVNTGKPVQVGKRVAVVGGGNTAMDASRCAKRSGADKVYVVYRRTRDEMPAEETEIAEAMEEGVEFLFLAAPTAVEGAGKVERLLCERMILGEPDASGRRRPVPTGDTFTLEVDTVIAAIGQAPDLASLPKNIHDGRGIISNEDYATPLPGVFVCGDLQHGPDIAIAAIGNGHWAAESVHASLTTGKAKRPFEYDVVRTDLTTADFAHVTRAPREHARHDEAAVRLQTPYEEYNHGLTEEQLFRDAARCMECGCPDLFECKLRQYGIDYEVQPGRVAGEHISKEEEVNTYYVRNMDKCILCGRCVRTCDEIAGFHAIDFTRRGFEGSIDTEYWKSVDTSACTSCGLCVQLCPVGALLEKRAPRKPHSEKPRLVPTACGACPVACDITLNLDAAQSRVVRVTTDLDNPLSHTFGNSCAQGRFDLERHWTNRVEEPMLRGTPVPWGALLDDLASRLRKGAEAGEKTAILVGGDLSNEEYRLLDRFAAEALPGTVLGVVGADALRSAQMQTKTIPDAFSLASYDEIRNADTYLLVETDTEFTHPVFTSWIRLAQRKRNARVLVVGNGENTLLKGEALRMTPREKRTDALFKGLLRALLVAKGETPGSDLDDATPGKTAALTGVSVETLEHAARILAEGKSLVTLIGENAYGVEACLAGLLALLHKLEQKRYLFLNERTNVHAALTYAPGAVSVAEIKAALARGEMKQLLFVGTTLDEAELSPKELAKTDLLALAVTHDSASLAEATHVLPLAHWTEREGTVTTLSGLSVRQTRGIFSPGEALPLTWILTTLARRLDKELAASPAAACRSTS